MMLEYRSQRQELMFTYSQVDQIKLHILNGVDIHDNMEVHYSMIFYLFNSNMLIITR
jgi:hypothetical protein